MPKILKQLSLIFLSSVLFLNSVITPFSVAKAQEEEPSTWYNQGFTDWYAKVYGDESPPSEIFGERYTAAQVQWIVYGLIALPINFLGTNMQEIVACSMSAASSGINIVADAVCAKKIYDFIKPIIENAPWIASSTIQPNLTFGQSILLDYQNRPISGIKYSINLVSKFTSIPTANAQGFGYSAVDGLQGYWQGFRDIAYALTVLVVIVFAFMIMFRVKLSPQVVISVQSALPKVFGALILATFSYAIAGFVIDLSYVVGGLFATLMNLAGFAENFNEAFKQIVPINATAGWGSFYIFAFMLWYTIKFFVTALITLLGTVSGLSIYGILASLIMILLTIWVFILTIWYTLTLPFKLIKNLISLLVSIVIAPVQIVVGALVPSIGFAMWFRKIIAEALVFPLTGLFLFLANKTLMASMAASFSQSIYGELADLITRSYGLNLPRNLWVPPILGSTDDMAGILWLGVSFTFIVMIPKAVDIMKMLVMGAKFDFGSAIGEAMTPVKMAGGLAVNPQMDRFELAAKKAMKTPWEVASKGGPRLQAKYISLSALQKWLSGR